MKPVIDWVKANIAIVVAAFWSLATRTNRQRLHGNTAQKICHPPSVAQSITSSLASVSF